MSLLRSSRARIRHGAGHWEGHPHVLTTPPVRALLFGSVTDAVTVLTAKSLLLDHRRHAPPNRQAVCKLQPERIHSLPSCCHSRPRTLR